MSRFTESLVVTPRSDGRTWIILSDFGYAVGSEESNDVINVPFGNFTDFASVPRILWAVLPRWGKYGNAAVIHDWLYWDQLRTRKEADDIFLEGMGVLEVGAWTKYAMYWGVRAFGWHAWSKNARKKAAGEYI
jgi:hypothetical protein